MRRCRINPLIGRDTTGSRAPASCWPSATRRWCCNEQVNKGVQSMRTSRVTDDMFARIPALLYEGMTKDKIATMYGVTRNTLTVMCSQRGISLRKGGVLPNRTKLTVLDEPLPLSDGVLQSLRAAARALGKESTARLVSDL